jgi:hypothetical protein
MSSVLSCFVFLFCSLILYFDGAEMVWRSVQDDGTRMTLILQSALARVWCSRSWQHSVRRHVPEGSNTGSDTTWLKMTAQLQTLRAWRWEHSFTIDATCLKVAVQVQTYVPEGDSTASDATCLKVRAQFYYRCYVPEGGSTGSDATCLKVIA